MGKIDARELAQAGFRYLGRSYSEMDCQGFVERCLADCGNHTDLGGSNRRIYRREPLENKGSEDDGQNSSSTLN